MSNASSRPAGLVPALALALAALASPARAGGPTTLDTFTGGVNLGNWLFIDYPQYHDAGGNPDAYISGALSMKIPQLSCGGPSVFTGDYRLRNVTTVGMDVSTEFSAQAVSRPFTIMLSGLNCSVFVVGPGLAPAPGEGWRSFDLSFDPQSTTLPAGWQATGTCGDADAIWNTVIQDVRSVAFFWGDPLAYDSYAHNDWVLGADNARLTEQNPWTDLGGGTASLSDEPRLLGSGLLTPGSTLKIELNDGPGAGLSLAWIALSPGPPLPALGGTVYALPYVGQEIVVLDPWGALKASGTMPALPSGTELTIQFVCQHTWPTTGLLLSNAVRGTVP